MLADQIVTITSEISFAIIASKLLYINWNAEWLKVLKKKRVSIVSDW